ISSYAFQNFDCHNATDDALESEMFHVKVAVLSYVAVVASTFSIMLSPSAVRADERDLAVSLIQQVHSGTRFILVADTNESVEDEFVAEKSNAGASALDWRLAGTIIGPDVRIALFAQVGNTRAVPEGKAIDGWVVVSVDRSGVTLSSAGEIRVIRLE